VLVPALGGKVRDMMLGGRQWLWHNPDVPFALPREGARYAELEEAGGFDECFPTVGSCRLPSWVEGARRAKLPDHGELWAQPPEIAIVTDARFRPLASRSTDGPPLLRVRGAGSGRSAGGRDRRARCRSSRASALRNA
jgi:hypothetical protein